MEQFFGILSQVEDFYWGRIGFWLILIVGVYFTLKSRFYQFKVLAKPAKTIKDLTGVCEKENQGQNPIKLYFASVSGMAGLGNIVAVVGAVLIGGPGALFWLWIAALCGMIIKYNEIYLGVKYRVKNDQGGHDGGPMYYLQAAFKSKFCKRFFFITSCLLLWVYGVEIYQFVVIADTLSVTFDIPKVYVVPTLLILTVYAGLGGIKRLANICTVVGPIFILAYFGMCLWVIAAHVDQLPGIFLMIVKSAFSGHAALGGFAGSTFMMAAQQGISKAVYSGDIAIGYDSIIQSETRVVEPEKQARIAIFGILTDASFCTLSILVIMVTNLWVVQGPDIQTSQYVGRALASSFSNINYFMAFFIFIAGWTTIIAFLAVGKKSARLLMPKYGEKIFVIYSIVALWFFSFYDQTKVLIIMSVCGGLLVLVNLLGMLRLRNQIDFDYKV